MRAPGPFLHFEGALYSGRTSFEGFTPHYTYCKREAYVMSLILTSTRRPSRAPLHYEHRCSLPRVPQNCKIVTVPRLHFFAHRLPQLKLLNRRSHSPIHSFPRSRLAPKFLPGTCPSSHSWPRWVCTAILCPSVASSSTGSGWSPSRASEFPSLIPPPKSPSVCPSLPSNRGSDSKHRILQIRVLSSDRDRWID